MHTLAGGCHCGNIHLDVTLSRAPIAYEPRACDCDFCVKHGASYVSDAQGSLRVAIKDGQSCLAYRHGSGQAAFLTCRACGVVVGVFYGAAGRFVGAVNVNALDEWMSFGPKKGVSPKKLSPGEKTSRWQELWFPAVDVVTEKGSVSGL